MNHFLAISDLTSGEVQDLLDLAIKLKNEYFKKGNPPYFKGKVLGMIFQKPSLRTRVSFDMAMRHMGGDALYLSPNEIGLGKRESIADVSRVLSGYVQAVMARVFDHAHVVELARWSSVPVINGLTDREREWLEYAAILHDTGVHISYEQHHKHSYYLIKNGDLRGFEPDEIETIALIARYHRRATPQRRHDGFGDLRRRRRRIVRTLAAILRLAIDMGGSVSAEHGIGVAKVGWLEADRGAADVAAMRAIKRALDEAGIARADVYVTNADGSNQKNLTADSPQADGAAVWSPDGSNIAFVSRRDGNGEIYVMDADGANIMRVTNNSSDDSRPSWSPDGSKFVFQTDRDGNWEIYVMSVDGELAQLTADAALC